MRAYNNNGNFDDTMKMTANLPSFSTLYSPHHNKHHVASKISLIERYRKVDIPVRFLIFQIAILFVILLVLVL